MNNWQMAIRLSWFWLLLLAVTYIGAFALWYATRDSSGSSHAGWGNLIIFLLSFVVILVVAIMAYCTIAMAWHKYILRAENPDSYYVLRPEWPLGRYAWSMFKISLIMLLIILPVTYLSFFLIGTLSQAMGSRFVPITVVIMLVAVLSLGTLTSWILLRLGLVLPAIAVGKTMTITESFKRTGPLAQPLAVTAIAMVLIQFVPAALEQLVLVLAGPLSLVSWIMLPIYIFTSWVSFFIAIGLLTVIYGHLVEDKPV